MGSNINKYSLRLVKEPEGAYDLNKKINNPLDAVKAINEIVELKSRSEEVFVILTLDSRNNLTGIFEVSVGSLTTSVATPREIFKRAILANAASILLAHNHPSGEVEPSNNDIDIKKKLVSIGELIGIEILDHIIIGHDDLYLSMKSKSII